MDEDIKDRVRMIHNDEVTMAIVELNRSVRILAKNLYVINRVVFVLTFSYVLLLVIHLLGLA